MKKDVTTLTDVQKKEFLAEHFRYEVDMLRYSADKLKQLEGKGGVEMNMVVETFLFHARNLIEFFYNDSKKYPSDARAYDFFEHKEVWEQTRPPKSNEMDKVITRSGREMAHLTYLRISGTPPEKSWDCGQLTNEILEAVSTFLGLVGVAFVV